MEIKLGNTFGSGEKFEKKKKIFSYFLAILKFLSHVFHCLATGQFMDIYTACCPCATEDTMYHV